MAVSSIRTLLIEDNPADARALREVLAEVPEAAFELEWVDRLAPGLQRLNSGQVDLLLLDLHLPESHGLATFNTTHACAPGVPTILLTGLDDRELALKAVRDGAQDYLVKGQTDGRSLVRSMLYAIVRHRMQREAVSLSWKDELTGLHNREGFLVVGEQLLLCADNSQSRVGLAYADVDSLKTINQAYGRQEGDAALVAAAEALCQTFTQSDLVARVGGDEFAAMCFLAGDCRLPNFQSRFRTLLHEAPGSAPRPYTLTVSWGLAVYDPARPLGMAALIKQAEAQVHHGHRDPALCPKPYPGAGSGGEGNP